MKTYANRTAGEHLFATVAVDPRRFPAVAELGRYALLAFPSRRKPIRPLLASPNTRSSQFLPQKTALYIDNQRMTLRRFG